LSDDRHRDLGIADDALGRGPQGQVGERAPAAAAQDDDVCVVLVGRVEETLRRNAVGYGDHCADAQPGETLHDRIDQPPDLTWLRRHGHVAEGVTKDYRRVVLVREVDGQSDRFLGAV
jgi:hypothetical protein